MQNPSNIGEGTVEVLYKKRQGGSYPGSVHSDLVQCIEFAQGLEHLAWNPSLGADLRSSHLVTVVVTTTAENDTRYRGQSKTAYPLCDGVGIHGASATRRQVLL